MDIHNIFSTLFGKIGKIPRMNKRISSSPRMHPQRDWLFLVSVIMFLTVAVNLVVLYGEKKEVNDAIDIQSIAEYDLDVESITKTAALYHAKEERFQMIVGRLSEDEKEEIPDRKTEKSFIEVPVVSKPESTY
ncbi:MAG: hypothetical protein HGB03_03625 [Candidatus Yonathbacteria bacterium]|nr:hypothetical protein [Candidatus Yonathbacteria bacterium]NTW47676.1 hypothetical protein [Candidatus Yonathbacteria bacterium]